MLPHEYTYLLSRVLYRKEKPFHLRIKAHYSVRLSPARTLILRERYVLRRKRHNSNFMDAVHGPPISGSIRFLTGPLAGNSYPISKPVTSIGREPGNDIVVSDPSVSRHHAQINYTNGVWTIKKVSPQNSLTLNQRDIPESPLRDRDTVGLGTGTTFLVQLHAATPQATPRGNGDAALISKKSVQTPVPPVVVIPPPSPLPVAPPPAPFGFTQPAWSSAESDNNPPTQRSVLPGSGEKSSNVPELEVSSNTDHERLVYPLTQSVIDIGRDPANTIVINRPTVSSFHAQIVREGNQLVLIHPHPKRGRTLNGIDYNGTSISGTTQFREVLKRGDVIRISDENGTFVSLAFNDGSGAPQEIIPEIHPIPLGAPVITLGRLPDNNVVLNHPQVSGHHARLEQVQRGYRITDLGSTNHVYVNANRISHQLLQPGDEVRIGPFKLTYTGTQLTQQDESNGIRIDALHLKKSGNKAGNPAR